MRPPSFVGAGLFAPIPRPVFVLMLDFEHLIAGLRDIRCDPWPAHTRSNKTKAAALPGRR